MDIAVTSGEQTRIKIVFVRRFTHQERAEQSDLLRDDSFRDYLTRRGYYHDLLGRKYRFEYLYQPTLAEFLYLFMRSRFIFQILYRNAELCLSALRTLDRKKRAD